MKRVNIFIGVILAVAVLMVTCKKEEKHKGMFNGNSRYRGVVYFKNLLKSTKDTVKNASLTIYETGDPDRYYVIQLTDGKFDLTGLSGGDYIIKASYNASISGSSTSIVYQEDFSVSIPKDSFQDNIELLIAKTTLSAPVLLLTVKDIHKSPVPNAQVCLYTDPLMLSKNKNKCTGSVKTATTNGAGIAVFADLPPAKYYAAAFLVAGADTISNALTASTIAYGPFTAAASNSEEIFIIAPEAPVPEPEKPALQVVVTDANGAHMTGAQVCIYSDLGLITRYTFKCTGSLKTATVNQDGLTLFTNMQTLAYYISASKVVGKDTLSNIESMLAPTTPLRAAEQTKVTVVIK